MNLKSIALLLTISTIGNYGFSQVKTNISTSKSDFLKEKGITSTLGQKMETVSTFPSIEQTEEYVKEIKLRLKGSPQAIKDVHRLAVIEIQSNNKIVLSSEEYIPINNIIINSSKNPSSELEKKQSIKAKHAQQKYICITDIINKYARQ